MKKYIITIFLVLVGASSFAQDLSDLKFCVNPGHGGHDASNDRFITATGFWESEGNLVKGLYLREILENQGATVVMSRVLNRDVDDLPLSQISAIANANNVDYFQSIHSNGWNGRSNYTLILFRGYDNQPVFPASKALGLLQYDHIADVNRTNYPYGSTNVRGDWDFYDWGTSGLGVLRNLNMPGTLSEGSFHDYIPESWRLRNERYCHHEAWAIARSFVEFYDKEDFQNGIVAGIVRNPTEIVNYYYQSGTKDARVPYNNIEVTLLPEGKVYHGDTYNNGFFMFDSVAPGEHTVIVKGDEFYSDTMTVQVYPNRSTFSDTYCHPDTSSPPMVKYHAPEMVDDSVRTSAVIELAFDKEMDINSVGDAFTIEPTVQGEFLWSSNLKSVTFTPNNLLENGTEYTVTIDTTALNKYGVHLEEAYSFSFVTRATNNLRVVSTYPTENAEEMSRTVQVRLIFETVLNRASISGNIKLLDENDNSLGVYHVSVFEEDDKSVIYFEPQQELEYNKEYRIFLSKNVFDMAGFKLGYDRYIPFTTTMYGNDQGTIIDDFEKVSNWKDPRTADGSSGLVNNETEFLLVSTYNVEGKSGQLKYMFDSPTSICVLQNLQNPSAVVDQNGNFGMWIFGDLSANDIEYQFKDGNGTLYSLPAATIDWTGWKMIEVSLSEIEATGDLTFYGVVLKANDSGANSGTIYLDEVQSNFTTGTDDEIDAVPTVFSLDQNYPNPFNPSTTIRFSIPEASNVRLTIYNQLGEEVKTLLNREMNQGSYHITFDAADLATGIYLYRLSTGTFSETKKMLLLK